MEGCCRDRGDGMSLPGVPPLGDLDMGAVRPSSGPGNLALSAEFILGRARSGGNESGGESVRRIPI